MVEKAPHHNFTFPTCPHCGQPMRRRHGVDLPPMSALIFDLIEASGMRGVTPDALAWTFFPTAKRPRKLVICHVNRINNFLESTDVRVRMNASRDGAYVVKYPRGAQ